MPDGSIALIVTLVVVVGLIALFFHFVPLGLLIVGLVVSMMIVPRSSKPASRFGGLALAATVDNSGRPGLEGRRQPRGWLLHRFGGHDVLEAGDVKMPEATGKPGHDARN